MNQTLAVDIWKKPNRVSLLWEDLLTCYESPDPPVEERPALEVKLDSFAAISEQDESAEPSLLERAGFESLRLLRHALEILTAPPEEEPSITAERELAQKTLPAKQVVLDGSLLNDPLQTDSPLGLTFIKVSREPDPQPGSAIDTRRIAYGLKIPNRPLHKRPVYQRLFFCLHQMFARAK